MAYAVPETAETARLTLRRARVTDAEAIFRAYATDPEVTRFLSHRPPTGPEQTRAFLARAQADWDAGSRFASVILRGGRVLGMIEARPTPGMVNYGYVLARAAWGQGCMTEVLHWHLAHSLAQPGIWRAEALCDAENLASARVMEKAGMRREGVLRRRLMVPALGPAPRDALIYAGVRAGTQPAGA